MKSKKTNPDEIRAGDLVAYTWIVGTIHVKVLEIKPDGRLLLNTKARNKLVKSKSSILKKGEPFRFAENIMVEADSDSVKKLKAA